MELLFSCLIVSCRQKLKAHNFENMQLIVLYLINLEISKLISLHFIIDDSIHLSLLTKNG